MKRQEVRNNINDALIKVSSEVSTIAASVLNTSVSATLSKSDQFRLLNLLSWSERYSISLREILVLLLPIWYRKYGRTKGLGVSIATLTGKKAKQILLDYLKKTYPEKENILFLFQNLRDSAMPSDIHQFNDPLKFVKNYKRQLEELREEDAKMEAKFKRRHWRGNPWLL